MNNTSNNQAVENIENGMVIEPMPTRIPASSANAIEAERARPRFTIQRQDLWDAHDDLRQRIERDGAIPLGKYICETTYSDVASDDPSRRGKDYWSLSCIVAGKRFDVQTDERKVWHRAARELALLAGAHYREQIRLAADVMSAETID